MHFQFQHQPAPTNSSLRGNHNKNKPWRHTQTKVRSHIRSSLHLYFYTPILLHRFTGSSFGFSQLPLCSPPMITRMLLLPGSCGILRHQVSMLGKKNEGRQTYKKEKKTNNDEKDERETKKRKKEKEKRRDTLTLKRKQN